MAHKACRDRVYALQEICIPNIPVPGMISQMPFGMSAPLPYLPPYHYPVPIPFAPVISTSRFPFPISFIKDFSGFKNSKTATSETKENSGNKKEEAPKSRIVSETANATIRCDAPIAYGSWNPSSSDENIMPKKFMKPKSLEEYKMLMKAVKKNPKVFPKILRSKKSQFLLSLGIAPKAVCSVRTLKKFRRQLKHKQFMTRDCMIYRERKMLRDRNKLKKNSDKKKHNYLGHLFLRNSNLPQSETDDSRKQQSQPFKIRRKIIGKQQNYQSHSQSSKVTDDEKKKPVEIIKIDCSDEEKETQEEKLKEDNKTSSTEEKFYDYSHEEETGQLWSNKVDDFDKKDKPKKEKETQINDSNNFDNKHISASGNRSENCSAEVTQNNSSLSEKVRNEDRILRFINCDNSASNSLPNNSSIRSKEKCFPLPQIAAAQSTNVNTVATNSSSYLTQQLNPTTLLIRRATPLLSQPFKILPASNENISPRIVYPINLSRAKPLGTVLRDKKQKGPYVIVPTFKKSPLSQNNTRIQPKVLLNSRLSNMTSSVISSRLQQIKPKSTEKAPESPTNHFKMGESSKIDINKEMARIAAWIYRMKSILNPCMLNNGEEKSVQKLLSQLDFGIHLVREAKKSLMEMEQIIDGPECPNKVID